MSQQVKAQSAQVNVCAQLTTAVTLTCGLIGHDRRRFVITTAVAAVIWALYAFFIGRLGGKAFEDKPWVGLLVAFSTTVVVSALIEAVRRISPAGRRHGPREGNQERAAERRREDLVSSGPSRIAVDTIRREARGRIGRFCSARLGRPDGTVPRMPPVWIGLTLAFASALVTNTAYSLEHDAAAALPPLSPRRPFRSAELLLRDRRWLTAFAAETAGWLMYVAALRLAPIALVQAVAASGVAVLAFATARGHPSRLARREQAAVVLAVAGLVLLALSLVGTTESDQHPYVVGVIIWLAACGGGAALLIAAPPHFARAASLGLAAGLLFADGDISAKLVGYGGLWLVALATLIIAYAVGTSVLQWAYQRGDALTAAGMATMATNAVPIAAGFVLFGETLPRGMRAVLQVAAFACLVASAVALGHQQAPRADQTAPRADRIGEGSA